MKPYQLSLKLNLFVKKMGWHITKKGGYKGIKERSSINQQVQKEIESEVLYGPYKYRTFEQKIEDCYKNLDAYKEYDENWTGYPRSEKPPVETLRDLQFILDTIKKWYKDTGFRSVYIDTCMSDDNAVDITIRHGEKELIFLFGYTTDMMQVGRYKPHEVLQSEEDCVITNLYIMMNLNWLTTKED